jgi:hypothetical protein
MDWQLKHFSRESASSGRSFEPGDRMVCLLFKDDNGELQRMDLHADEVDTEGTPDQLLGCWTREVKDTDDPDKEQRLQQLASSEELFVSLYDENAPDLEETDILKQILALLLERKRIIRPLSESRSGIVEYQHAKSKAVYPVSMADIAPEKLLSIQEQLQALIG